MLNYDIVLGFIVTIGIIIIIFNYIFYILVFVFISFCGCSRIVLSG